MVVNGDYRSSNYTMSSDDEVFNFPPIKKQIQNQNNSGLKESSVASFSNQIQKPVKKKVNPKLTMNMGGISNQTTYHAALVQGKLGGNMNQGMMISGNAAAINMNASGMSHNNNEYKMKHNSSN